MTLIVVVSGTGTGVGKTWVACRVLSALGEQGIPAAARKPVQSYDPDEGSTDADLLAAASGVTSARVCPQHRSLPIPMAPPIAAQVLGMPPFTIADLVAELAPPGEGIVLVEGAGGPRSPLAADGDTVTLARTLGSPLVLLVAGAGLGTINATILAAEAFRPLDLVVFLNRFQPNNLIHRTNLEWLRERGGLEVFTHLPFVTGRIAALAAAGAPA